MSFAARGLRFLVPLVPLIHLKGGCVPVHFLFNPSCNVLERTMALKAMAYLERRYTAIEKELADALG